MSKAPVKITRVYKKDQAHKYNYKRTYPCKYAKVRTIQEVEYSKRHQGILSTQL